MNDRQYKIVALVGRPNVGKSSLFNCLAKKNKAIVDPTPGVTRDRHYEVVTVDERSFILVDTGGIELEKVSNHEMEMVGEKKVTSLIRMQSLLAVEDADIIVFLMDAKEGLVKDDYELAAILRRTEKPIYYVINKIDNAHQEDMLIAPFYELGADKLWAISSAHNYGIKTFFSNLVASMKSSDSAPDVVEGEIGLAFIGRPNVGKSSLVNQILGQDRMVVSDVPGTTRDSVDTRFQYKGKNYLLIDTAGIRRRGKVQDNVERFSVMRALKSMERCDLALILIDAEEGITEQDTKVIGYSVERGRACLVLLNKWDLIKNDKKKQKWLLDEVEMATRFIGYAPTLQVSALTGHGCKKIITSLNKVYEQFSLQFTTGKLNRVLQNAVGLHSPSLYKGKRIKFYYTTQISTKPPTFIIYVNYPEGVHFSYFRFLVNQFRKDLKLDQTALRIFLRERKRKKYD
nr:ribosome biogenesis GTPase Der [Desulfobulbaceae bacterium]